MTSEIFFKNKTLDEIFQSLLQPRKFIERPGSKKKRKFQDTYRGFAMFYLRKFSGEVMFVLINEEMR